MTLMNHSELTHTDRPKILESFARKQLMKRLGRIPCGRLVIEDGDNTFEFGQSTHEANLEARMIIDDQTAYSDIAFGGSIGAAEAYMLGKWHSPNLVNLIRLMSVNIDFLNEMDDSSFIIKRISNKLYHWFNRNTQLRSRENISAHYDLGNDFFELFLDPTMMYSSAVFPDEKPSGKKVGLNEAAELKLELICQKLELKPSDHLLEIGTGWGGLAIYAAKNFGCKVTTTTISKEQFDFTVNQIRQEGLQEKITVLLEDYRSLKGGYDKLVSIEMIEAVGHQFYATYFNGCSSLLKKDGLMLLQSITIPDQRYQYAQKSVDFIQRYIFPGGSLPSHEVILTSVKANTDMQLIGLQEIGEDYAKTLGIWRERFVRRIDAVKAMGFDDLFIRMWDYYFCYCQGGFEERVIGTSQILLAKPDWRKS
jgi:cyclopropane-fatty-acyl-phospholipid synthase